MAPQHTCNKRQQRPRDRMTPFSFSVFAVTNTGRRDVYWGERQRTQRREAAGACSVCQGGGLWRAVGQGREVLGAVLQPSPIEDRAGGPTAGTGCVVQRARGGHFGGRQGFLLGSVARRLGSNLRRGGWRGWQGGRSTTGAAGGKELDDRGRTPAAQQRKDDATDGTQPSWQDSSVRTTHCRASGVSKASSTRGMMAYGTPMTLADESWGPPSIV